MTSGKKMQKRITNCPWPFQLHRLLSMISPLLVRQQSALLARKPLSVRHRRPSKATALLIPVSSQNVYYHLELKFDIGISRLR